MKEIHEMTDDTYETPSTTPNFQTELAAQLADLIPEAIADGKVDVVKLQELLGADTADASERFGLFWPGKKRALRAAQEPTTATLRPDFENSKDWDTTQNVFIEGDNLEVLKILQKHYHAKIKLIYIDPPYNTGKDFVYPDNFKEGLDTYLEWTRQVNEEGKKVSTNSESEGRYHSNWLNMMYPRLKLARNLLREDGVMLLSIGDDEFSSLRALCNEVFGESNFVGVFSRTSAEGGGLAKQLIKGHDYVLAYARQIGNFPPLLRPKDIRGKVVSRSGEEYWIEEDWFRRVFGKYGTCHYEEILDYYDQRKLDAIDTGLADGRYVLIAKNGGHIVGRFRKIAEDGSKFHSVIKHLNAAGIRDLRDLGGLDEFFEFPKPVSLIRDLVRGATFMSKDDGDIVLDFFAGSATTAQAVMELNAADGGNRRFIQVQLPEPVPAESAAANAGFRVISDISRERIDRAGAAIEAQRSTQVDSSEGSIDTGFRSYKLSDTNFSKWRTSSDIDTDALQQRFLELRDSSSADDATPDSLLTEILLKQGYSLTEKIASAEIAGLDIRTVGDNLVIAYLNELVKPTLDQLRALVDEDPARIIVLEDAFQGDDELKTNLAQLCRSKGIELWTA
jgi:adenine-specific DNA-methyltransferase